MSIWKWLPALLVVVVVVLISTRIPGWRSIALVGAGYVAKNVCSCVFVAKRSGEACRADIMPAMAQVESRVAEDSVTARVPLLATVTARHERGYGCTIE